MIGFLYSVAGFIIAIGVLVGVHEYGHFAVARKCGVKVLRFSIGFGKPIFTWRRKGDPTEYVIGAIPLGGYVKMLDERDCHVLDEEQHQAFNNKSLGARSAIVFAGPAINFLFAIVAMWAVYMIGQPEQPAVVDEVIEESIAARAGMRDGDRIIEVGGRRVNSWQARQFYLVHQAFKQTDDVSIRVLGIDGAQRDLQLDFSGVDPRNLGRFNVLLGIRPPPAPADVVGIAAASPASRAGLKLGDRITAIDAQPVANMGELFEYVRGHPGADAVLSVRRDDVELLLDVTFAERKAGGVAYGFLGLYHPKAETFIARRNPFAALRDSADFTYRVTAFTLRAFYYMVTAKISTDAISGPITIARVAGHTVQIGAIDFIKFMAIISISLGLINLFPVPMLDGGHLLYFAFEAVRGRPLSEKTMMRGQVVGLVLLMLLMSLAFYNDIMLLL